MRVGVIGGIATAAIPADELRSVALESNRTIGALAIRDGRRELRLIEDRRGGEVRYLGEIENTREAVRKLVRKLTKAHGT